MHGMNNAFMPFKKQIIFLVYVMLIRDTPALFQFNYMQHAKRMRDMQ